MQHLDLKKDKYYSVTIEITSTRTKEYKMQFMFISADGNYVFRASNGMTKMVPQFIIEDETTKITEIV